MISKDFSTILDVGFPLVFRDGFCRDFVPYHSFRDENNDNGSMIPGNRGYDRISPTCIAVVIDSLANYKQTYMIMDVKACAIKKTFKLMKHSIENYCIHISVAGIRVNPDTKRGLRSRIPVDFSPYYKGYMILMDLPVSCDEKNLLSKEILSPYLRDQLPGSHFGIHGQFGHVSRLVYLLSTRCFGRKQIQGLSTKSI